MSRTKRILIDNSYYHIINRGNRKKEIFKHGSDYRHFLSLLKKAKKKHKVKINAYCLMPNHIHIIAYIREAKTISSLMHYVSRNYASYFNSRYEKVGHLWQSRFKSYPLLTEEYLIHVANYIEINPVKAKIVDDPSKYTWSSYNERCLMQKQYLLDPITV
ncbi:MAG: hypothetical protein GF408_06430 [Candidatus Omnitrophica bacterium]|nr:hypothetical protein [Candidatus Omnitrophota bacterium]